MRYLNLQKNHLNFLLKIIIYVLQTIFNYTVTLKVAKTNDFLNFSTNYLTFSTFDLLCRLLLMSLINYRKLQKITKTYKTFLKKSIKKIQVLIQISNV